MRDRESLLAHLYGLTNRGIKLGLDAMREAATTHGNPQSAYHSILVGGTNGKGSTCAYLESALRASGFKTGLYTSPHLVRFEERFAINGRSISTEQWLSVYHELETTVDRLGLTFFEAATLIAFELFKREGVQWAVVEVGLGGRLDATNILEPDACIITSIGMDHQQYLGNTLTSIAGEKLGIAKKNVPLFTPPSLDPQVNALFEQVCIQQGAPLCVVRPEGAMEVRTDGGKMLFSYRGSEYRVPLVGEHQVTNALLAIETLTTLRLGTVSTVQNGLAEAWLPGRFQEIAYGQRSVVFDVAHNPAAISHLVSNLDLRFPGQQIVFVIGIMADKEYREMVPLLCQKASHFFVSRPDTDRASRVQDLLNAIPLDFKGESMGIDRVADAVHAALRIPTSAPVCVTGSFFTVGEAVRSLGIEWDRPASVH